VSRYTFSRALRQLDLATDCYCSGGNACPNCDALATVARRVVTLEARLAWVLEDAQVGHRRTWRDGATRGRVWSSRRGGRTP
jgi:hypothetical protein